MKYFRIRSEAKNFLIILILHMFFSYERGIAVEGIVNGQNALPGMFPFIVSIQTLDYPLSFCSGSILDEFTIVTTATCFTVTRWDRSKNATENCFKIVAGNYDLSRTDGYEQTVAFSPSDVVIHEHYSSFFYEHDIALIQLKEPLKFSIYVKPIALKDLNVEHFSSAVIAGWGGNTSNSVVRNSHVLQMANVRIFSNRYCQNQWGDDYHQETMICAGGIKSQTQAGFSSDACQGDTGGPLVARTTSRKRYLVGIISWGFYCDLPYYPGIYTKVESYLEWIQKNRQNKI